MTLATKDISANVAASRQKVLALRNATNGTVKPASKQSGQGDRWSTLNAFVDGVMGQCTEAEVRVWLVLYREVKPGGQARVGMTDIARRTGMTRRGVVNAINGLKRRRLIEVVTRGTINGSPNSYRLLNTGA